MGLFDPNIDKLKKAGNAAALIKALGNKNPSVREDAASALGELGGADSAKAIADAYGRAGIRRKSAIASLARIGVPDATDALTGILIETDWNQRKEIAKELKEIGLQGVPSGTFWFYICDSAAVQLKDEYKEAARRSVEAVLACLGSPDRHLRWDALIVLEELALPFDEKVARRIVRQLDEKKNDLYMVEQVVKVLGGFKSRSLAETFIKCLDPGFLASFAKLDDGSRDNTVDVFAEAVSAIGKICDEGMAKRLLPALERELTAYKDKHSSMEIIKARQVCIGRMLELLGRFVPAALIKPLVELEGFDNEKLEIAKRIGPESLPDGLVPALAKHVYAPFAKELLRKKGDIAAKELVRRFMADKDKGALKALEGMEFDAAIVAPLVEKLPYSDFDMIEAIAGSLAKAKVDDPTIKAYGAVLGKDWSALRALGQGAAGPIAVAVSKGGNSSALKGSAAELMGLLCDLDFEKAYSVFYDLPPGDFREGALSVMLQKAPSQEKKDKILESTITSMVGALKSEGAAEETRKKAAVTLKRLYAEGSLSDAMKQRIVECKGAVIYKERKSDTSGHNDDCLTSGPPDTWHTDEGEHHDYYVDVVFKL